MVGLNMAQTVTLTGMAKRVPVYWKDEGWVKAVVLNPRNFLRVQKKE